MQPPPLSHSMSLFSSFRTFSTFETLSAQYKYYCEVCCSKQEATKRLRVKQLPMILALHLKRFKFMEHLRRHTKLSHRVVFPWELKLFNTVSHYSASLGIVFSLFCKRKLFQHKTLILYTHFLSLSLTSLIAQSRLIVCMIL